MTQNLTILFDLDGTIVNTAPDLMAAHNHVMKKFGFEEKKMEDIKTLAGKGAWVMMQRSFKEEIKDEKTKKAMTKEFIDYYAKNIDKNSKPLNGTFSAFMDVNKIRTYDHFYHAPICEDNIVKDKDGNIIENNSFSFDTDIESQFRLIPGAFPEEDISVIYEEEKRKDSHDLRNPYYFYGNPKFIENTILYENDIKEMFLKIKSERPLHHEDDSHLAGFESQYD